MRTLIDKLISDCCEVRVTDLDAQNEKGICTRCGKECWACDPKMLKSVDWEILMGRKERIPITK